MKASLVVIGWLGDRVRSRQTPFLFGLIALGLSTLAISLTRSITVLLIARILQGLSGAVVYTVGFAILFDVVGSEKIGQAMGFVGMSQSFGLLVGPAVGGWLYEWGGYFRTFIPAFMMIALEIALRSLVVVRKERRGRVSQSLEGDEEEGASKASLLADNSANRPHYGTNDPPPTDLGTAAPLHQPNNQVANTKAPRLPASSAPIILPHPVQPLSTYSTYHLLLSTPRIPLALTALFTLNSLLTSYDATLPIHISRTFAYPASYASLLFLIMVTPFLLSPLAGYAVDHHGGPKLPAFLGLAIVMPPVFILRSVTSGSTAIRYPFLTMAICLFTIGLGSAAAIPALMAEVSLLVESIERERPGVFGEKGVMSLSFGILNTAFGGGYLAGPMLGGWLVDSVGWAGMNVVLGTTAAMCAVAVGAGTGGWIWKRKGEGR
ncbi:MAG: hypothetical protein LQ338_004334 [Usnochroma carphineum]|nr:MAG: hypothetical protein LQ338_004334 [Usnochroma carphineum]